MSNLLILSLDLDDPHARKAMLQYAESCRKDNPELAQEIRKRVLLGLNSNPSVNFMEHDLWEMWDSPERIAQQVEMARERALAEFVKDPIAVTDGTGEVVAYVVREYDSGFPDTREQPGDPGWDYWRFANLKEISEMEVPA